MFWNRSIVFLTIIIFSSCSRLTLTKVPVYSHQDWQIYGGNIGRTNQTHLEISPPLINVWENVVASGFGTNPASYVDHFLCVGTLNGEIHLLDIQDNVVLGKKNFGSAIIGTPIIDRNSLYVALSNEKKSLISYDLLKGMVNWTLELGEVETSPLIIGENLYVTTLSGKLFCIEKKIGKIIWMYDPPIPLTSKICHSSPSSDGKVIVYCCDGGYMHAIDLFNGKMIWQIKIDGSILSSPSILHNKIFVGSLDSSFYSFDISSGKQLWQRKLDASIYTSQAVDDNCIYVNTVGKSLYCLSNDDGRIIWEIKTKGLVQAPPLVSENYLYVTSLDGTLSLIDLKNGEIVWQYRTESRIKSMPIITQGRLFLFSENRTIIAFKSGEIKE